MSHSNTQPSSFLVKNLPLLESLQIQCGVLDLACGYGRNGLFLLTHNVPVIFADNNESKLQSILPALGSAAAGTRSSEYWLVDFELEDSNPLVDKSFDAILVFNYLYRPLFAAIKEAIRPGGLIVYETFTIGQRQFGRPNNPDFLLNPGELVQEFQNWEVIESFEGVVPGPDRAVARLIARKPIL